MIETPAPGPRGFDTTHWSRVQTAQSDEVSRSQARKSLEVLCRSYWYPLYAFVRHRGYSSSDAEDLTQSFLLRFLETGGFASADRTRGRFRTYLLGAMKHFLANEWHRARALKRGGGLSFLEWDALNPEARYALEPRDTTSSDSRFDREWAVELTDRALGRLREESEAGGKGRLFQALRGSLTGSESARSDTAALLGMTAGALKVAVHRLRQRYRELLRAEIADTVSETSEIEDEMRHLIEALRQR